MSAVLQPQLLSTSSSGEAATAAGALEAAFVACSPRHRRLRLGWRSAAIHGGVLLVFLALTWACVAGQGLWSWSLGLAYLGYDTLLMGLVLWGSWPLLFPQATRASLAQQQQVTARQATTHTLAVLVAAHNEASVLPATVKGLLRQSVKPHQILLADDGSTDDTPQVLRNHFGLLEPKSGQGSRVTVDGCELIWLRLPHGGKARALNAALTQLDADILVTVDADTLLAPDALQAMRKAFEHQPDLVAATGVLKPVCANTWGGRGLEACQQVEYMRNFLTRHAWMRLDGLLLISGAFAGFKRNALVEVGGFDPLSMVEDYEVVHRLRWFSGQHRRGWTTAVVGGAQAITDAPATTAAFLRQRRRWFGGFLQTQWLYRDMVGRRSVGAVGTRMLPAKAIDTVQPLFAWFSLATFVVAWAQGGHDWVRLALAFLGLKTLVDTVTLVWLARAHKNWQGDGPGYTQVVVVTLLDPLAFQPMRQLGALMGWLQVFRFNREWGSSSRGGLPS